jgi:hypothetical protein
MLPGRLIDQPSVMQGVFVDTLAARSIAKSRGV